MSGQTDRSGQEHGNGSNGAGGGFGSLGLTPELLKGVAGQGFTIPTAIQSEVIPAVLAGHDVLGCAMTGSGKTAAFLLPILTRLQATPRGGTRALVLAPTRELAAQIVEHFRELAKHTRLSAAAIYGGVGMGPQEHAFRRRVDVLVATPGRLLDHFQYDYARLDKLEYLVLDEADRMLDMGFMPAIRRVLTQLPKRRQTLLFSATMPREIVQLSCELMRDPRTIGTERKQAPPKGVKQALFPVASLLKPDLLLELLRRDEIGNAIVFCRTKHRAKRLTQKLAREGIAAAEIHGNRSQSQRTKALDGFKSGSFRVLVATDVVARGIDVEALEHVINFDVPDTPDSYIHRIGRTARAEATGEAYTFVAPEEEGEVRDIERALGRKVERRTVAGFDYAARAEKLEINRRPQPRGRGRRPAARAS